MYTVYQIVLVYTVNINSIHYNVHYSSVHHTLYHDLATFTGVTFVNVHHVQMSTFVCLWYYGTMLL